MSKKKRQFITVIVLFVVLAASGIGYFAASKYQAGKEKEETETSEEIQLLSMKAEDITKIRFINEWQDMTLVRDGDVWQDSSDAKFPVNQEYVQVMLEDVMELTATQLVVENPEDLAQYELEKPNYQIEITDQSGATKLLAIGQESVAAGGCYAYVDQADKVYTIASNLTGDFSYTRNEMMAVPEAPDITAEYVTGYALRSAKGKSFVARYDAAKAEYTDVDGWDITKAYKNTVAGSGEALQNLFSGLTNLEATEGVAYQSNQKLLKQYGLSDPAYVLDVDYYTVEESDSEEEDASEDTIQEEDKTYHHYQLSIGALNDTEDQYYVAIDGSEGIYLMSTETLDALVDINAFDYVSKPMYALEMETLQSIQFEYQGKQHQIKVSKKEVENAISEDGSIVYDYTILLDGTELDENAFKTACSSVFSSLIYSGEVSNTLKGKGKKAQASMTITTDQRKIALQFLPYDGNNFYRVENNGTCEFLADINVVSSAMDQLLSVTTAEAAKAEKADKKDE